MAVNKVLVADDSYPDLESLKSAASKAGCRVLTATSGKEAVAKAKSKKPDLVLMDIVMDDLDGYGDLFRCASKVVTTSWTETAHDNKAYPMA